eukprot:TRINITY_DN4478_c0_g1_i2.p1 TRINITY_DN4478_c0_g1~~TRINITY_DN4478_c0_g1_i2.p1  ORF type:complete len:216 (-),score=47.20 TRINITY_DN4478_c0_g1_i2:568-1215(-)
MTSSNKANFNPDMFLTRAERLKHINIPDTTDDRIIVRPNNEAMGFKYNCYVPSLENNGITKDLFDQTVRECTKICEFVWRKKKLEENAEYMPVLKYILFVAIFFVVVSFLLLTILIYARPKDDDLLIVAIICIVLAGTLTMFVIIKSMLSKPEFINLEAEIYTRLRAYLTQQNNSVYTSLGGEWRVNESFYWLELHIRGPTGNTRFALNYEGPRQ